MEVTDIAKIVRKKRFWILQMKTHKVELVKNVKKNIFELYCPECFSCICAKCEKNDKPKTVKKHTNPDHGVSNNEMCHKLCVMFGWLCLGFWLSFEVSRVIRLLSFFIQTVKTIGVSVDLDVEPFCVF